MRPYKYTKASCLACKTSVIVKTPTEAVQHFNCTNKKCSTNAVFVVNNIPLSLTNINVHQVFV